MPGPSKSGSKAGRALVRSRQRESSDDEEMHDDVDLFHLDREKSALKGGYRLGKKKQMEEEVLSVDGEKDLSDDEDIDEDNVFDDSENENLNDDDQLPSADKWGKKRSKYLGTDYVDKDFGQGSDSDEELAALEEEDATRRQKLLDQQLAQSGADLIDLPTKDVEKDETALTEKSEKEELTFADFRSDNLELKEIHQDYLERKERYEKRFRQFEQLTKRLPDCTFNDTLTVCLEANLHYFSLVLFYLWRKSLSVQAGRSRESAVDDHPVVLEIQRWKKILTKEDGGLDGFLFRNYAALEKMLEMSDDELLATVEAGKTMNKAVNIDLEDTNDAEGEHVVEDKEQDEEDGESGDEKRPVTLQIQKNKASLKKKKSAAHSRSRKREQYHKALVKRRSQVADVRKEMSRYDGEKRGIRASTVKSTKLIA